MAELHGSRGDGRRRVVIEAVTPQIDGGEFPAKRAVGEDVVVEADMFCDGHDLIGAVVRYRRAEERGWSEAPMRLVENDRWRGSFTVDEVGRYRFTVRGWVDAFATWRRDLEKKIDAGQDVGADLLTGALLVEDALGRTRQGDGRILRRYVGKLREGDSDAALDDELAEIASKYPDRSQAVTYDRELDVIVDV